jgi:glycosyltransferase involved in cell wall biosynthesis
MQPADSSAQRLTVSVIVPARNEEAGLGTCLSSLVGQTGIDFEIIVVDDGSTDRTREIAQSFSGVRTIAAPPLPPGWGGKNNALVAGASEAHGQWLLFTDADTTHLPGSLAHSVNEAKKHEVALLSYSPEQEVRGFCEKAVMPVIFAELAAIYRPSLVSDPKSPAAAANGQYLLVSREAYDAVGGHAAVAGNLLEDVALARLVKASGRKIFFRYGGDAVRTRMYRSFAQLREGWTKNLALLFPSPLRLALLRMIEFVLIVGGTAIAIAELVRARTAPAIVGGILTLILFSVFFQRIRKAHFTWDADVLAIFGLPLFSYLLWRSHVSYKRGSIAWKGREYESICAKNSVMRRTGKGTASAVPLGVSKGRL